MTQKLKISWLSQMAWQHNEILFIISVSRNDSENTNISLCYQNESSTRRFKSDIEMWILYFFPL